MLRAVTVVNPTRKLRRVLVAAIVLAAACNGPRSGSAPASAAALKETAFAVEGMTCGSCDVTVRLAARRVDGVKDARVSRADKRAWVTFDPGRTSPEMIARAITDAGYAAKPITPLPEPGR